MRGILALSDGLLGSPLDSDDFRHIPKVPEANFYFFVFGIVLVVVYYEWKRRNKS